MHSDSLGPVGHVRPAPLLGHPLPAGPERVGPPAGQAAEGLCQVEALALDGLGGTVSHGQRADVEAAGGVVKVELGGLA